MGLGINDLCVLPFLHHQILTEVRSPHATALAQLFLRGGFEMAAGQAADLSFTDLPAGGAPLDIARGKTGGELAALLAAPAVLQGTDPAPWQQFGRSLGALIQIFTDYLDLFTKEHSDDWTTGKPTFPIRHVLSHPTHGAEAAVLLAGLRSAVSRQQAARWLMIRSGTAQAWRSLATTLLAELDTARAAAGEPPILAAVQDEARESTLAVDDALALLADAESPPDFVTPEAEAADCRRMALAFLHADPAGSEAIERHRWGLFGQPYVEAGVFGALMIAESLFAAGVDASSFAEPALALVDTDGWRYYPGHREIPPDADDTGLALQVLARMGRLDHPGAAIARRALAANLRPDFEIPTWLEVGAERVAGGFPLGWMGHACPGAMANAVLGWHRARGGEPDCLRAADRLAAWLDAPTTPDSVFYRPVVVDALGLMALTEVASPAHAAVRERVASRLLAHRRLGGQFGGSENAALAPGPLSRRFHGPWWQGGHGGSVLETAFAAIALAPTGRLDCRAVVRRALVDAQQPDGGFEACPFYLTVGPHYELATYASRLVTTALVVRALAALESP